jgi:putative ABC transport system substrate-binding protein
MRRRDFITLLGAAAAAWPLAARAQQAALPMIGCLGSASRAMTTAGLTAFHEGLKEGGYVEGQNVAIEYRWAEGQYDRLPALAAELVRRKVAVIFTSSGTPSALAAKAATSSIPIVFSVGSDPVEVGLVSSLGRPAGNATGATFFSLPVLAKRLELLREIVPAAKFVGVLVNPRGPTAPSQTRELQTAGRKLELPLHFVEASSEREFDAAFSSLIDAHVGALFVSADGFFTDRREPLAALALRHALPLSAPRREWTEAGALFSYGASEPDTERQGGVYTARILKGAAPGDLPVLLPTKFELVINLKTAKALGIDVSVSMQLLADEVIE